MFRPAFKKRIRVVVDQESPELDLKLQTKAVKTNMKLVANKKIKVEPIETSNSTANIKKSNLAQNSKRVEKSDLIDEASSEDEDLREGWDHDDYAPPLIVRKVLGFKDQARRMKNKYSVVDNKNGHCSTQKETQLSSSSSDELPLYKKSCKEDSYMDFAVELGGPKAKAKQKKAIKQTFLPTEISESTRKF